ncbi:uncharacterized protein LOC144097723 [Amblyomma americanum]
MTTPSTSPAGQAKDSQPGGPSSPPQLRSVLKCQSPPPASPPTGGQPAASAVVRSAVHAAASAAAMLGTLAKRSRSAGDREDQLPAQRRLSPQGPQPGGDQRQPIESESSSKSSSLTPRGKQA